MTPFVVGKPLSQRRFDALAATTRRTATPRRGDATTELEIAQSAAEQS